MTQETLGPETTSISVTGMSCTGCEERITRVLERLAGVAVLEADHQQGQVVVRLEPGSSSLDEVRGRIERAGFGIER